MSDYEATAYLSLEKLKVLIILLIHDFIGKTYVRVLVVSRKNQERIKAEIEILKRSYRIKRQGSQVSENEKIR